MELAKILADNLEYLKINNIEKAIGLNKTALVRMIARKEIPEKHKDKVEKWWNGWVMSLIQGTYNPEKPFIDKNGLETSKVAGEPIKVTLVLKNTQESQNKTNTDTKTKETSESMPEVDNSGIKKQIEAIKAEKIPEHRNTPLGRRSWQIEQDKRIVALQKQME